MLLSRRTVGAVLVWLLWEELAQAGVGGTSCSAQGGARQIYRRLPDLQGVIPSAHHAKAFTSANATSLWQCLRACTFLPSCTAVVWKDPLCYLLWRLLSSDDLGTSFLETSAGAVYMYRQDRACPGAEGYTRMETWSVCVKLHLPRVNFDVARAKCQQEGADLALAKTHDKLVMLDIFEDPDTWIWLGTQVINGSVYWLDNTRVSFAFGKKSANTRVNIRYRGYYFGLKTYLHSFLCEIPL